MGIKDMWIRYSSIFPRSKLFGVVSPKIYPFFGLLMIGFVVTGSTLSLLGGKTISETLFLYTKYYATWKANLIAVASIFALWFALFVRDMIKRVKKK